MSTVKASRSKQLVMSREAAQAPILVLEVIINWGSFSRAARERSSLTRLLNERAQARFLGSLNKQAELELLIARLG